MTLSKEKWDQGRLPSTSQKRRMLEISDRERGDLWRHWGGECRHIPLLSKNSMSNANWEIVRKEAAVRGQERTRARQDKRTKKITKTAPPLTGLSHHNRNNARGEERCLEQRDHLPGKKECHTGAVTCGEKRPAAGEEPHISAGKHTRRNGLRNVVRKRVLLAPNMFKERHRESSSELEPTYHQFRDKTRDKKNIS